jgi:hypothetical protein
MYTNMETKINRIDYDKCYPKWLCEYYYNKYNTNTKNEFGKTTEKATDKSTNSKNLPGKNKQDLANVVLKDDKLLKAKREDKTKNSGIQESKLDPFNALEKLCTIANNVEKIKNEKNKN